MQQRIASVVVFLLSRLRRDALTLRVADDLQTAFGIKLGEDVGNVGLHGASGQVHALGDVRSRVALGD